MGKVGIRLGVLIVFVGALWFFLSSNLDPKNSFLIAQGAFEDLATSMQFQAGDFKPPEPPDSKDQSRLMTLSWISKVKSGCRIEVDVDRRYSGARPRYVCEDAR